MKDTKEEEVVMFAITCISNVCVKSILWTLSIYGQVAISMAIASTVI